MTVKEVIAAWRALPERRLMKIRWGKIPEQVADSMAAAGDPMSLEWLNVSRACTPPLVFRCQQH